MRDFLSLIGKLAPKALANAFQEIVKKKFETGDVRTKNEILQETERLQRAVGSPTEFKPSFRRRLVPDVLTKIRSSDINANADEALIDVNVLYEYANLIDKLLRGHITINQSEIARIKDATRKLASDIQGHILSLGDDEHTKVIYSTFTDGRNFAQPRKKAHVNSDVGQVKLRSRKVRRMHEFRGVTPTTVSVSSLTPTDETTAFSAFAPENCIDPDLASFWASLLMTDGPIETVYDGTVYPGVIVELILDLPYTEKINEVKFSPFGQFPVQVLDIRLFAEDATWTQFNGFTLLDPSLKQMEWNGTGQPAKRVKFVVQQESYKIVDYMLPDYLVQVQNLWTQVIDPESRLILTEDELTSRQLRKSEFDPSYNVYLEGLRKLQENLQDIEIEPYLGEEYRATKRLLDTTAKTMAPGDPKPRRLMVKHLTGDDIDETKREMVEMRAYEYVLGAYHVEVNNVEYFKENDYISPKFKCPGTLSSVELDVTESHPGSSLWIPTSVEYEIELSPSRTAPILPTGTTRVYDEFVFFHPRTKEGITRFAADAAPNLVVRANGVTITDYSNTALGDNRQQITIGNTFKRNTRYTVSYDADTSQNQTKTDIDALFNSIELEESYEGTDNNGMLQLRHHPYIEMAVINDTDSFHRYENGDAVWEFVGSDPVVEDAKMYGMVNSMLALDLDPLGGDLTLSNTTNLPWAGSILIGNEEMTYTGIAGNQLLALIRPYPDYHPARTPVIGRRLYEPLNVQVVDAKAQNLSAYETDEHPSFMAGSPDTVVYQYIQIRDKLYFNAPLPGKPIRVRYSTMAEYIRVNMKLRSNTIQKAYTTPVVSDYMLKIRHSVI